MISFPFLVWESQNIDAIADPIIREVMSLSSFFAPESIFFRPNILAFYFVNFYGLRIKLQFWNRNHEHIELHIRFYFVKSERFRENNISYKFSPNTFFVSELYTFYVIFFGVFSLSFYGEYCLIDREINIRKLYSANWCDYNHFTLCFEYINGHLRSIFLLGLLGCIFHFYFCLESVGIRSPPFNHIFTDYASIFFIIRETKKYSNFSLSRNLSEKICIF